MTSEESRFETDPGALVGDLVDTHPALPSGWHVGQPDPEDRFDLAGLTRLLRDHERQGRGWAGSSVEDVLVEVSAPALRTRQNLVIRDADGAIRAWGGVHDRAGGRMLLLDIVDRGLDDDTARACSEVIIEWAVAQARSVGAARGLSVQQIDTGTYADDERQAGWLADSGFTRVRTWWQMSRPVGAEETDLVPSTQSWEGRGVRFRRVRAATSGVDAGMPDERDLRAVHDVLEEAFRDHFNSWEETFEEFVHRIRESPGHRWDHWWLAELVGDDDVHEGADLEPVGALIGTVSHTNDGPDGSYVAYLGVREAARGRGVAKGLLRTIITDAASRGRDRVGLEVDADSETGATGLYESMGWTTSYVTESWHRDVPVD